MSLAMLAVAVIQIVTQVLETCAKVLNHCTASSLGLAAEFRRAIFCQLPVSRFDSDYFSNQTPLIVSVPLLARRP